MPRTRLRISSEFRRQMVDLGRAGRSPEDLDRELKPTAQSIGAWVAAADKQEGRRGRPLRVWILPNATSWRDCDAKVHFESLDARPNLRLRDMAEAAWRKASAEAIEAAKSFVSRLLRLIQAKNSSTPHRRAMTAKPAWLSASRTHPDADGAGIGEGPAPRIIPLGRMML